MPFKPARREPNHPAGPVFFMVPTRFSGIKSIYPPMAETAYSLLLSHVFVSRHPDLSGKIWDTIAKIKKSDVFKTLLMRHPH